jgi:hypothetical protein
MDLARPRSIQPYTRVAARRGPSRLQVALAAAWLIASLAIGGAIAAERGTDRADSTTISTATQP